MHVTTGNWGEHWEYNWDKYEPIVIDIWIYYIGVCVSVTHTVLLPYYWLLHHLHTTWIPHRVHPHQHVETRQLTRVSNRQLQYQHPCNCLVRTCWNKQLSSFKCSSINVLEGRRPELLNTTQSGTQVRQTVKDIWDYKAGWTNSKNRFESGRLQMKMYYSDW